MTGDNRRSSGDMQTVLELQSPFSLPTKHEQPVRLKLMRRKYFPTEQQYLEYARSACVQTIRDWLQPRFHRWAVQTQHANLHRRWLLEIMNHVLPLTTRFIAKLLSEAFTEAELESSWGQAFFKEIRQRLLPTSTLGILRHLSVRVLSFSLSILGKSLPDDYDKEISEESKAHSSTRAADMSKAQVKIYTMYEEIDKPTSVLRGIAHFPSYTLAQKCLRIGIRQICRKFDDPHMYERMKEEMHDIVQWLSHFDCHEHPAMRELVNLQEFMEKETIEQLMKIIYEVTIAKYPQSQPAVALLSFCFDRQKNFGREELVTALVSQVEEKLLKVGTSTAKILQAYASAVESLKMLDPSCVIMHRVCRVIKDYIKKRPDTVRQIITYITMEKREELDSHMAHEMAKQGIIVDEEQLAGVNDEFLPLEQTGREDNRDFEWMFWMPDPPDTRPGESGRNRRTADVFNMLVSVYGSKEMFVKEYRQLLAERLTNPATKDTDFERRYLDLLKMRFSDGELQHCEVMLRDMTDSEDFYNDPKNTASLVASRILSFNFWPEDTSEPEVQKFNDIIEADLEACAKLFESRKFMRTLMWHRDKGTTDMTLSIDGVETTKTVPNVMADVLYQFCEKEEWEVGELAELLQISKVAAKKRLEWWQGQGVLNQYLPAGATSEMFRITKTPANMEKFKGTNEGEEEEEDQQEQEDPTDAADCLEQYWKYTKQFITNQENNEAKPERLLQIYKMFASPSSQLAQVLSIDVVISFLNRKVKLGLLTANNGVYKVVKEPQPEATKA